MNLSKNIKSQYYIIGFFFLCCFPLRAQKNDSLNFPILVFSPTENYNYIAVNRVLSNPKMDGFSFDQYEYVVPFGVGLRKDILEKDNYQLSIQGAINVQFIFRYEQSDILNGIRKTHFNTDFFVRLHNTFRISSTQKLRLTVFHRSTHLGDDYVVLNPFSRNRYWSTDETNYEALQVQYAVQRTRFTAYGGSRYVFRPDTPRKRLEFQSGVIIKKCIPGEIGSRLFVGFDAKALENNGFNLDIDIGLGYTLSDKSHVRLQYYTGNIPFSRLERSIKSTWLGVGYYLNVQSL